jgi:hypothetical protein
MPLAYQVVGIAMNATTGAGEQVRVLKSGFGTAALVAPTEVRLNSTTNDQTFTDTRVIFRDSGGLPAPYGDGENFKCIFDAGVGETWTLQFVTDVNDAATYFSFEQALTFMYDRLGIQTSADGVSWTNINVPWMQTSNTATAPWGAFIGGNYNESAFRNGWIVPKDVARANELGYVTGTPVTVNSRYLRFWFVSDASGNTPGWNIGLSRTKALDVPLYIDVNDLSKVTVLSGGALIGSTASIETFLGSILVRR